jgi:hypothetical protein
VAFEVAVETDGTDALEHGGRLPSSSSSTEAVRKSTEAVQRSFRLLVDGDRSRLAVYRTSVPQMRLR